MDPYPASAPITQNRTSTIAIKENFGAIQTGEESQETVRLCGRILTRREMGKAAFAHLQDFYGQLQIYVRKDLVGEALYELFCKNLDLGDILGSEGKIFRTKTGELSLKVEKMSLLAKALRPLPEKWHGLKDVEIRARQRELDLIANPESKKIFLLRSRIIQSLRSVLESQGYLEVETPIMQSVAGGAIARPFETFHNALGQKFFLRVAPELYLKKCLVGGFEKVFEIGRVFRNEGIDALHNPEFTILEAYESYGNMESMMTLTELLIQETAQRVQALISEPSQLISQLFNEKRNSLKPQEAQHLGGVENALSSFGAPPLGFERITVAQLFEKYVGNEEADLVREQNWSKLVEKFPETVSMESGLTYKVFDHLFSEKIAPHLSAPTFVTEFPSDLSPLAKCKQDSKNIAERFELYVAGEEIANAYSELNDPEEQKMRLEKYRSSRTMPSGKEEGEGMGYDESFITALEYGMPPAGGLGIGVDRLVMLFAAQKSIRDVLLFPTLKNERA